MEKIKRSYAIHFSFSMRDDRDLERLNDMLSGLELTSVDLRDFKGYVACEQHFGPDENGNHGLRSVHFRYGLDSGVLVCEEAWNEEKHIFRMDTVIVPGNEPDHEGFTRRWHMEHPDRVIRTRICLGDVDRHIYILLHHEKDAAFRWLLS